jgi:hypothetical protein
VKITPRANSRTRGRGILNERPIKKEIKTKGGWDER